MNAVLTTILTMLSSYIQSPQGQEKLVTLLPTLMGLFQNLMAKIEEARSAGLNAEMQKQALARHIAELAAAAAAKAEADHKAHPDDDSGFDPGVFRD